MHTYEKHEELVQQAAYQVKRALSVFKHQPFHIQQQAMAQVLARVQQMYHGMPQTIHLTDAVKEI